MNKFTYAVATLMLTLGMFTTGCSQSPTQQAVSSMSQDKSEAAPAQLNIRYVDMDSIAANYNLARDLQEAQLRAYSRLNAAGQH